MRSLQSFLSCFKQKRLYLPLIVCLSIFFSGSAISIEASKAVSGYDVVAKNYERGRPDYPQEIQTALCQAMGYCGKRLQVLDLASGTGKVSKALASLNVDLVAVEPSSGMREEFKKQFPAIPILEGSAERIPMANETVDIVCVGTAFHLFNGEKALLEIHRVLKPGGRLVLIWNSRAREVPWVKEICDLVSVFAETHSHDSMLWKDVFEHTRLFGPLAHTTYRYSIDGGKEEVFNRLFSSKALGVLSSEEIRLVMEGTHQILEKTFSQDSLEMFPIPYRIELYWGEKVS